MAARTWRRGATLFATAMSVTLVVAACGGGDDSTDGDTATADAGGGATDEATGETGGVEGGGDACAEFEQYGTFDGGEIEIFSSIRDIEADKFVETFAPFSECTGLTINWNGTGEFEAQLQVRVQGGDAPDIATIPQPGLLATLVAGGSVVEAPAEVAALVDEGWSESWKGYGTVDDTFYAAPLGANVKSFVWYSPSYFADNGYEIPETWDDMLALSDEIAATGIKPWCAGIESGDATGWVVTDWFEDVVLREVGADVYDQWVSHVIPFNDPQIAAAAERVGGILKNDAYVNGGYGDVQSITITAFQDGGLPILDGQCAMHRQASFYANQWPDGTVVGEDGDVFAFYLPVVEAGGDRPVLGGGEFVTAFNDNPETVAVQTYMASAEFANAKATLGAWISANTGLDVANVESPIDQLSVEILQDPESVFRFDASDLMPAAVGAGSFWSNGTDWINGSVDTPTMLNNIEASWPAS